MPIVYSELPRLAASYLRGELAQSVQPTARWCATRWVQLPAGDRFKFRNMTVFRSVLRMKG
jgi:hypothetical protein